MKNKKRLSRTLVELIFSLLSSIGKLGWKEINSREDLPTKDGLFEYCVNGTNFSREGVQLVNAKALEKLFNDNINEELKLTHYKRFKFSKNPLW